MKNKDCEFCKIARKETKRNITLESNNFIAFPSANPVSKGHTLVVPKKHFVTILDIKTNLGEEMLKMIKDIASDLLDKKLGDGFNILMRNLEPAGQEVMHAHIHIIPRKEGDGISSLPV